MERLEEIVHSMEAGELSLEELLLQYEEGTRLAALCGERLASAEKRLEIIARNAAGEPSVEEFDPAAAPPPPSASTSAPTPAPPKSRTARTSPTDDISLF